MASRWPLRFSPAAEISRLTSASVRYSRERTSALRRRFGGPALSTVPYNGGRRHQRQMRFFHGFSGFSAATVP